MNFFDYIHKFLSQSQTADQSFLVRGCNQLWVLAPSDWSLMSDLRSIILCEKPIALRVGRPLAPKAAGLLSLLAWRPGSENLCP
jgi:hypothetical protein